MLRVGAACAVAGTIVYIAASVLHSDPPVDDVQRMLDHVGQRPWWRAVHLANILAVLLWVAALTTLTSTFARPTAARLGSQAVLICTSAVFTVYSSIHGFGLKVLAGRWAGATATDRGARVIKANAVFTLLGSTAFTAQALLGLTVTLYGLTMVISSNHPRWLGTLVGAGGLAGTVLISFDVIIPFTVLAWSWMLGVGVAMWRRSADQPVARKPHSATL
jgi:hypothetical protein